ncbi:MAG: hypothetical protein J4G05_05170 [Chlorobi bacterium]|nr:hypothetical protein [Chlorobiota bacterium]
MKRFMFSFLAISMIVPLLSLSGCWSGRVLDFTVASTKDYDKGLEYSYVGRVEGKDKVFHFLIIPFGRAMIDDAINQALETGGGVYLTNVVVRSEGWSIGLLGQLGYKVEGDLYAPVSHGAILDESEERFTLIETEDGTALQSAETGDILPAQDVTFMFKSSK